jgi:anti-sigma factor RsiW
MTNETEILSDADEIAALLPWYVSGKISTNDKDRVDAYANAHPAVRRHITLAREEADAVFSQNQEIAVPRDALDKLRTSVASSPSARLHAVQATLLDKIGVFLGGLSPRHLAYAGVAAALAIAVQAASIGALLQGQGGSGYQTASGDKDTLSAGTFALVAFQPAAPAGTLSAFLAENKFTIVEGPKAGGLFRVRVGDAALSPADTDAMLAKLKARGDLVSFAAPAPQTP